MIGASASVATKDRVKELVEHLKGLADKQVYVGIPEEKTARRDDGINNAQLLYIHTHGSPARGIPERPVIEPAIEASDNKDAIAGEMAQAVKALLDGKYGEAKLHMKRAGMTGMNAARSWFDDPRNNWPDNKPATIRHKLRKLRGQKKKDAMAVLESGEGTNAINTVLVDTAQMRRAITYVLGEKEQEVNSD